MCHNSVGLLGDGILFILGWSHLSPRATIWVQNACHVNAVCLATVLSGLYGQFDHVLYCKHLKLVYMFTTRPLWRHTYYITWYTHRVP